MGDVSPAPHLVGANPHLMFCLARRTEVAYFLVPWMFLTGVDLALSLLLVNAIRYLIPHDSVFAKIFNVSAGKAPRRSSAAGLLSSSELDSYTIASSAGDVREPEEAGGRPS